ncbi:MAG: radical SAM protein [Parcubacteria group bacterium]|nr:radical SAM protein [Parcubacteria group bacterium]
MRIQTFSILAGSEVCNARCPFCISKMTPPLGVALKEPEVNWRNFEIACRLAKQSGVTTAMFTGKGEPTLFPGQINKYLDHMESFKFPFIELQTNGIMIASNEEKYAPYLKNWYDKGMTTIAISIVHYDPEKNREVYLPHKKTYIDLAGLIGLLHDYRFSVRLICIGANGFIDSTEKLLALVHFAKEHKVEQLTLTPVNKPENILDKAAWEWTNAHHLTEEQKNNITSYVEKHGARLMTLAHGAVVFDLDGQNLCLNQCLTVQPDAEEMRNLIFFPDGHLRYYWQYPGAILL